MKIWHDDIRRPPDDSWVWVRTNEAARRALEQGRCVEISMDHDMGHHDRAPDDEDSVFLRGDSEDDGTQLAKWMVAKNLVPQSITIHSWNPDGAKRMAEILRPRCLTMTIQPYEVQRV